MSSMSHCVQECTAKRGKRLSENVKVGKLHVSKQSAGHHWSDTSSESQHSYMDSQGTSKLEILSAGDDFSQSSQQHDTVKRKVAYSEKVSKKDAADIVVRQLTPYYKSHRFGSKVF